RARHRVDHPHRRGDRARRSGGVEGRVRRDRRVSTDETSPVTGRPGRGRVRRERGVTESLLSIVLVLEAAVMFFATLAIRGLSGLPEGLVLAAGFGFLVLLVLTALVQRYAWG